MALLLLVGLATQAAAQDKWLPLGCYQVPGPIKGQLQIRSAMTPEVCATICSFTGFYLIAPVPNDTTRSAFQCLCHAGEVYTETAGASCDAPCSGLSQPGLYPCGGRGFNAAIFWSGYGALPPSSTTTRKMATTTTTTTTTTAITGPSPGPPQPPTSPSSPQRPLPTDEQGEGGISGSASVTRNPKATTTDVDTPTTSPTPSPPSATIPTSAILVGILVGVIVAVAVFCVFYQRRRKQEKKEQRFSHGGGGGQNSAIAVVNQQDHSDFAAFFLPKSNYAQIDEDNATGTDGSSSSISDSRFNNNNKNGDEWYIPAPSPPPLPPMQQDMVPPLPVLFAHPSKSTFNKFRPGGGVNGGAFGAPRGGVGDTGVVPKPSRTTLDSDSDSVEDPPSKKPFALGAMPVQLRMDLGNTS
ncbi:hypothetical protein BDR26DRAFT_860069 [Obelidium mucronatum]|nr:hypothetical protein BDR26DRAFT_860069 [Obelidium mucronatum]